jgi:filamentous hemagglutinin family protein
MKNPAPSSAYRLLHRHHLNLPIIPPAHEPLLIWEGGQADTFGSAAAGPALDRQFMVFKSDGGDEAVSSYRRLPSLPYRGFPKPQTVRQPGAPNRGLGIQGAKRVTVNSLLGMMADISFSRRDWNLSPALFLALLTPLLCPSHATANPTGGTVSQGAATFSTSGSQLTIKTAANTFINWSSFNIAAGETTTFVEPTATSVVWNQINSGSPSQILGNLNANGYVVLQNQSGFYIGGQATLTTRGLLMTTAPVSAATLSSGDPWTFNAPPPTASIINYGQINVTGGGSAFLLADNIENQGAISAPSGKIGLYAGEQVLVSMSPDGRGLSAQVTLPQGSVDNEGRLIADGGAIAAQAQTVNQNGLVQANSVQSINGVIELVASDSLTLGASSDLEAHGDTSTANTAASPGGFVVLQSGNTYADTPTSIINVSGQNGGQDGIVEIIGTGIVQSQIGNNFATLINPVDITLSANPTDTSSTSPNFNVADLSGYSQIDLHALDTIEVSAYWSLGNLSAPGAVNLSAGNNLIFDDGCGIGTGENWSLNLAAGTALAPGATPASGLPNNGIYLNGDASLYTLNGDINLWAANEIIINGGDVGGITTFGGGNITATAVYGDVNTGDNVNGYFFGQSSAPYYSVSYLLGGISTALGGNVTINAGGDVISFLPIETANPQDYVNAQYDGGSGAYGPEPGNVTITAGGNVYGHYVVANGVGTITAGANVGAPVSVLANTATEGEGFALSLVSGSWSVYAPNGSIYVQDVRDPNAIFGEYSGSSAANYAGYHYVDYSPLSSVLLDAGDSVEVTGYEAPHVAPSDPGDTIPILFPPLLTVIAGAGGFILDTSVILFPSADQGLSVTTLNGGNFGIPNSESPYTTAQVTLEMSGSAATRWVDGNTFLPGDQASSSTELNDPNSVTLNVSGSMNDVNLYVTKAAQITVGGDMINCGFIGENLHSSDVTSINVTGQIYDSPEYTFVNLTSGITSANALQPSIWDSIFDLALNPDLTPAQLQTLENFDANNPGANGLAYYLKENNDLLFPSNLSSSSTYGSDPGFVYSPATPSQPAQLGFAGRLSTVLSSSQIAALEAGTLTYLVADGKGNPIIDANGNLEIATYTFTPAAMIATLETESADAASAAGLGLQIGGPGAFTIHAGSIDLGNTAGIGSDGFGHSGLTAGGFDYSALAPLLPTAASGGASVTVTVDGDLTMATSGIYSRDGGDVTVAAGGTINLSQGSFVFPTDECYGIYTSGHSDVSVTAEGDINIGSSRIATFDGGNVFVESYDGDVNAGNGANIALFVYGFYLNPVTDAPAFVEFGDLTDIASLHLNPAPYGSGILAEYPTATFQAPGAADQPGNITVLTPGGNIGSSVGGISQFALDQTVLGNPFITLDAGIPGVTGTTDQGNVTLGDGGVVGVTVNIAATGTVQGLIVSKRNSNIDTQQGFTGTLLAGGSASFSGGGGVSGLVVGIGGISVSGGGDVSATLLSQNVSVGGEAAQSTLGATASATSASQSAAGQATSQVNQQLASTTTDTDDLKKKKKLQPLLQKIKRVTVLLPRAG